MITPLAERLEKRARLYDPFRNELAQIIERSTKGPVENWWFATARSTLSLLHRPNQLPPEAKAFVDKYVPEVLNFLRSCAHTNKGHLTLAQQAVDSVHQISHFFMSKEPSESKPIAIREIPLEDLPQMSKMISFTTKPDLSGEPRRHLAMYFEKGQDWDEYPIPNTPGVLLKSPAGRITLKRLFGTSSSLTDSEHPQNDIDIISLNTPEDLAEARKICPDSEGIEIVSEFDIPTWFRTRDLTMNCAFIGCDSLIYSDEALESAKTGRIKIISEDRGIYGTEKFVYQGTVLYKDRGLMRYVKTIAEGKARSFELTPLNTQVDLGVYWLVLVKRFSGKKNFHVLADRLYEIAKKIGQVPPDSKNIYDVLDRVHSQHSYYDFASKPLDEAGVARWLSRKLGAQIRRKYREELSIPSAADFQRTPGDTVPFEVHLDDYQVNPPVYRHFLDNWPSFLSRCQQRTEDYLHSIQKV